MFYWNLRYDIVCVFLCVCVFECVCVCACAQSHVCTCICTHICVCEHAYIFVSACMALTHHSGSDSFTDTL